jgi:hypothetical protein
MLRLDRGVREQVSQTTAQQGRPQGTVLRFDRHVYKIEPILKKRKKGPKSSVFSQVTRISRVLQQLDL